MLMKQSAQIPQSDGSAGLSSLVSAVHAPKRARTGDFDFKPTTEKEKEEKKA